MGGLGRQAALPVLSGVLFSLAFPGSDAGYLAWIALVPLLVVISRRTPRDAFVLGCLTGFLAFVIILSWMRLFGIVPWLLLAGYLALYIGAFAGLYRWVSVDRPVVWSLWVVPLLWTVLEYVRSVGVFGFPWALLGVSQHAVIPLLQVARITGVYGVSFLVALVNAAVAAVLMSRRATAAIVPVLVVTLVVGWGVASVPPAASGPLAIATLQTNVAPPLKFDPTVADVNMRRLEALIDQAETSAELIVMPETALPSNIFGQGGLMNVVGRWAQRARATLIATSLENGVSNIAVAVAPSGMAVGRYDKMRLVAFAESGIHPGYRHDPLWTPLGRIGVAICFESIFPEVSRDLVRGGAQVLAVITNDAWSDGTAGPIQHARFAPFRAAETGRWVIHATNSGLSQIVDPAGRVVSSLPVEQAGVLEGRVALSDARTFYVRWGDWFPQLALVALLAVTALLRRRDLLEEARIPALPTAAVVSVLPLITMWALLAVRAPWWTWASAVVGFVGIFAAGRVSSIGLGAWTRWRGFPAALLAGSAVVGALWSIIVAAFRANQIPVEIVPPADGWVVGALRQLFVAAALESWLRGQAFTALVSWKGTPVAVAMTALIGMAVQFRLPAEAMAWAMVTGIAFGVIRARTGNVLGLIIPHALGNLLLAFLTVVR